jgi:hypothetical protein
VQEIENKDDRSRATFESFLARHPDGCFVINAQGVKERVTKVDVFKQRLDQAPGSEHTSGQVGVLTDEIKSMHFYCREEKSTREAGKAPKPC